MFAQRKLRSKDIQEVSRYKEKEKLLEYFSILQSAFWLSVVKPKPDS